MGGGGIYTLKGLVGRLPVDKRWAIVYSEGAIWLMYNPWEQWD